jgi:hypothetical protein
MSQTELWTPLVKGLDRIDRRRVFLRSEQASHSEKGAQKLQRST